MCRKILYSFLLLSSMLYAKNTYYYIETKECTLPIKSYMKKIDKHFYGSTLTDKKKLESRSSMSIGNREDTSQKTIQKFKEKLSRHNVKYGYTLYYYDKNFEKISMPSYEKISLYMIELGKVIIVGSVYDPTYIEYMMQYCYNHKK